MQLLDEKKKQEECKRKEKSAKTKNPAQLAEDTHEVTELGGISEETEKFNILYLIELLE